MYYTVYINLFNYLKTDETHGNDNFHIVVASVDILFPFQCIYAKSILS